MKRGRGRFTGMRRDEQFEVEDVESFLADRERAGYEIRAALSRRLRLAGRQLTFPIDGDRAEFACPIELATRNEIETMRGRAFADQDLAGVVHGHNMPA